MICENIGIPPITPTHICSFKQSKWWIAGLEMMGKWWIDHDDPSFSIVCHTNYKPVRDLLASPFNTGKTVINFDFAMERSIAIKTWYHDILDAISTGTDIVFISKTGLV